MNNFTNSSNVIQNTLDYKINQLLGYYIIPISSLLGAILGITYLLFLSYLNFLRQRKYRLIFSKLISLVLMSLIFINYQNRACILCPETLYNSYGFEFYGLYILRYPREIIWFLVGCFEMYINYDRYCILNDKKNHRLHKMPVKYIYLMFFVISFTISLPDILAYQIKYSNEMDKYFYELTWFGQTDFYNLYILIVIGAFYLIQMIVLIMFNSLNLKAYNQFIKKKQSTEKKIRRSELLFSKMIIIETTFYIFNLMINYVVILTARYGFNFSTENSYYLINILRNLNYEFIILACINDIIVLISFDKNLLQKLKKTFAELFSS
jgi:hypothetical protein